MIQRNNKPKIERSRGANCFDGTQKGDILLDEELLQKEIFNAYQIFTIEMYDKHGINITMHDKILAQVIERYFENIRFFSCRNKVHTFVSKTKALAMLFRWIIRENLITYITIPINSKIYNISYDFASFIIVKLVDEIKETSFSSVEKFYTFLNRFESRNVFYDIDPMHFSYTLDFMIDHPENIYK
jgi:hypothetical protein